MSYWLGVTKDLQVLSSPFLIKNKDGFHFVDRSSVIILNLAKNTFLLRILAGQRGQAGKHSPSVVTDTDVRTLMGSEVFGSRD